MQQDPMNVIVPIGIAGVAMVLWVILYTVLRLLRWVTGASLVSYPRTRRVETSSQPLYQPSRTSYVELQALRNQGQSNASWERVGRCMNDTREIDRELISLSRQHFFKGRPLRAVDERTNAILASL